MFSPRFLQFNKVAK